MATYEEIQMTTKELFGFVPKTCWIADVKADFGLTTRFAPNRVSHTRRKHPCPVGKRDALIQVLAHLRMIRAGAS